MAEWPGLPAGYDLPLVNSSTKRLPDPTMDAIEQALIPAIATETTTAISAAPQVSPVPLTDVDAPVFVRNPTNLVTHSASGFPSIYWPYVYSTAHIEGAPGAFALTLTTDHDAAGTPEPFNGRGGVCQYYADHPLGPWTQVRSGGNPVIYQDTTAGDQTETATTIWNESSEIVLGGTLAITTAGVVTLNTHRMPNGQQVRVTAKTGATGIEVRDYYVVERAANTFKLALTRGGAAVTPSTSGTLAVTAIGAFHHYYQQQNVGVLQSTVLARSYTGHIADWQRYGIVIQGDELRAGDGQTTYTKVDRVAAGWIARHINGGGDNGGHGISYSRDGLNWITDPRRVSVKDFSPDNYRRPGMSGMSLFRRRGVLWGIGSWGFYTSGFWTGDRPWILARPTPDLRSLEGQPLPVAVALSTGETDSTAPTCAITHEGKVYAFYRSNGQYGTVRAAVAEA